MGPHDDYCDEKSDEKRSGSVCDVNKFGPNDEYCDERNDERSDENYEKGDEYGMVDKNQKENHDHLGECSKFHSLEGDDSLPNKEYIMRKCTHCGIDKYKKLIERNNPHICTSTDELKWKLWENIHYEKDGEKKSTMGDKEHHGDVCKLVNDYMDHLDSMSLHQFNKIYQTKLSIFASVHYIRVKYF